MTFTLGQQDSDQLKRLRAMKRIPLLLLVLMAVIFFLTLNRPESWAGWVHAFSEAAMVGALADWFAVVALFRHPLGIPIPHTAIVPRRKNEIGDSLAGFVAEHFLQAEIVRNKLATVNLAKHSATWMLTRHGRQKILDFTENMLRWVLGALNEQQVRRFIARLSTTQIQGLDLAPMAGRTLDWLIRDGRHQQLLTRVLRQSIVMVHDNREQIRQRVQQESPWWMPGFVDDRIVQQMLDRIEALLLSMALDEDHEMRSQFDQWLQNLSRELQHSREYHRMGEQFKKDLLENRTLQDYLYRLWQDLADGMIKDLDSQDSGIRKKVANWVDSLAKEMLADEQIQTWINRWLTDACVGLVENNRESISSLISDTVRSWDAMDTSQRVELAIGRDLQFIRINGTLVGGLVGLVIYALTTYL